MAAVKNVRIFDGKRFLPQTAMRWENGVIQELLDNGGDGALDGGQFILSPGFVDIHIHGIAGCNVMDSGALEKIMDVLPQYGVTSFCPGAGSATNEDIQRHLSEVRNCMSLAHGAQILGSYLEGPYLSARCKGANNETMMREPSVADYKEMTGRFGELVVRVTIALEMPDSMELVKNLAEAGTAVSVGHSAASAQQVMHAADLGMNSTTHTFNGMLPLHHREPGVLGASLTDKRIYAEFIADMVHLDPMIVKLIYMVKGVDKSYFCTDSISATGMPDGIYGMPEGDVIVKNGVATLGDSLAGSTLTMDRGFRNLVSVAGIPLESALQMGTLNPLRVIGKDDRKGRIAPGFDADFILLDGDLRVRNTVVNGRMEYGA